MFRIGLILLGAGMIVPGIAIGDTDRVPATLTVAGRVVDSKGRPVSGVNLYLGQRTAQAQRNGRLQPRATTAPDGRFRFTVDRIDLAMLPDSDPRESGPLLVAFAEGHGPAWTDDLKIGEPDGLLLKLADDFPIAGRLVDLESRPIPNATVRVIQLDETLGGDLSRWLDEISGKEGWQAFARFRRSLPAGLSGLVPSVTTGPDGRFHLKDLGRERLVTLLVEGPTIATHVLGVITRPGASRTIRIGRTNPAGGMLFDNYILHAGHFDDVCAPTRIVEGTVRDRDTGLPLPGVVVRADGENLRAFPIFLEFRYPWTDWRSPSIRTTTDAQGRYRLSGLPIRDLVALRIEPSAGQPYFGLGQELANRTGSGTNRLDLGLQRGILIRGRVTDRATGKPAQAIVDYHPASDNPNSDKERRYAESKAGLTQADGSFVVVALPGPGVIAATAIGDRYLHADQVDEARDRAGHSFPVLWAYQRLSPSQCHSFAVISPEGPATCDLALTPGPEPTVKIVDPAGRPLAGSVVSGISAVDVAREGWWQARGKATFPVEGMTEHRIRVLFFHHEGRKLAGKLAIRDGETGPLVVRLRPWGSVSGRLVDRDGRPRAGVKLSYRNSLNVYRPATLLLPRDVATDVNGRFAFEGLVAGQDHVLRIAPPSEAETPNIGEQPGPRMAGKQRLKPGETRDLGDVQESLP